MLNSKILIQDTIDYCFINQLIIKCKLGLKLDMFKKLC